jgi:hypothetical protein
MAEETNPSVDNSRDDAIFNEHKAVKHENLSSRRTRHGYISFTLTSHTRPPGLIVRKPVHLGSVGRVDLAAIDVVNG